ncbi:MAG: shikimate dehydrogenase [Candidatus Omnitrophica bacterium]|nr:shikimate dehydrogenase [Candidatus Omnitrophota bacterium]
MSRLVAETPEKNILGTVRKRHWAADYKLYAIFGYPLKHTFSPVMHNKAFKALGLDSYYIDIPIRPERFKRIRRNLRNAPLDGFNLTVPHKELIVKVLDSVDREAGQIGAVNTVLVKRTNQINQTIGRGARLIGYNTDTYGFREALRREARFNVHGKSVLVLGAGGAARACVQALIKEGVRQIIIANRTVSKARRLISDFSRFARKRGARLLLSQSATKGCHLNISGVDLVVNSTSLGLKKSDPLPIKLGLLPKRKLLIFDLIYNPSRTKLLREASKRGYRTMNGLPMLLYQGAKAFEIWTGKQAPIHVMRKALNNVARASRSG